MRYWSLHVPAFGAPHLRCWQQPRPSPLRRCAEGAAFIAAVTAACIAILALGAILDA